MDEEFNIALMLNQDMVAVLADVVDVTNQLTNRGETITEIVDQFMWIGNMAAAKDEVLLKGLGVTHILGATSYGDNVKFHPNTFKYFIITLPDVPESDLSVYFDKTNEFVKECRDSGGRILIHCAQGRSRSATLLLAYLMLEQKITYYEAIKLLKAKRPQCQPNDGFQEQLCKFQDRVLGRKDELPNPGDSLITTIRAPAPAAGNSQQFLRVVSWNIQKGYAHRLPRVVTALKSLGADIILLQDVDFGCKRTQDVNVARYLAEELQMSVFYTPEFKELYSPQRGFYAQGGGVIGSAILTKHTLKQTEVKFFAYQPFGWNEAYQPEPRQGGRVFQAAIIETPLFPVLVANLHLETECGMAGRLQQFLEAFAHTKAFAEKHAEAVPNLKTIIGGDFSTIVSGASRLLGKSNRSWADLTANLTSMGTAEAEFWDNEVFFDPTKPQPPTQKSFWDTVVSESSSWFGPVKPQTQPVQPPLDGKKIIQLDELQIEIDPHVCRFSDPFSKSDDITHTNIVSTSKADWLLTDSLKVLHKQVGPRQNLSHEVSAGLSDHLYIIVDYGL